GPFPLTASIVAGGQQFGQVTLAPNGTFTYTPTTANNTAQDFFLYRVFDGTGLGGNTTTVFINFNEINDNPTVNFNGSIATPPDGPFTATEDTPLVVASSVLANDFDVDT